MNTAFRIATDTTYAKLLKRARNHVENGTKDAALKSASLFHAHYPQDAEANYNYARSLVRHDKKDLALVHAEKASAISPENPAYLFLVGRLYLDFQLYEFAAPLLRDAVVKLPNDLLMQWAMADFLLALGDGQTAKSYYEIALNLQPNNQQRPLLLVDYARCLNTMGLSREADAVFAELEEIEEYEVVALAKRSAVLKHLPDSEMAGRVNSALNTAGITTNNKSELLLSMGNMHNNAKEFDRAFELWTESRDLRTIDRAHDIGYNTFTRVTEFYNTSILSRAKEFGHSSKRPLFVLGMPRSGTTLTEQIVSSHPQVFGVGELGRVHKLAAAFERDYAMPDYGARLIKNAEAGELVARANETLKLLEVLAGPEPKYVVDKMPSQYLSMGYTHLCFPQAKFIHCQRHPADSFISSFQSNMSQFHEYSFDQIVYAEAYLSKEKFMAHWRSIFPEKIFDLHYEKLVTRPEETVRELLNFIELPWDPECMKFFEKARTVKTFSTDQVRQPIYTSSVYRWKNYEKHLGPLFAALKEANYTYPEF
jgi:tetratricopeptide (TPR) repeat protein